MTVGTLYLRIYFQHRVIPTGCFGCKAHCLIALLCVAAVSVIYHATAFVPVSVFPAISALDKSLL